MSSSSVTSESFLEKFEFYFIGLTFTLLGASIQTSNFQGYSIFSIYLELMGWGLLTVSGLIGLSKIEWISSILYVKTRKSSLEEVAKQLRLSQAQGLTNALNADNGQRISIKDTLANLDNTIENYNSHLNNIGKRHEWKHQVQKYSFAVGLIATAIARGIKEVQPVLGS